MDVYATKLRYKTDPKDTDPGHLRLNRHPDATLSEASAASVKAYAKLEDRARLLGIDLWDAPVASIRILQDYVIKPTTDGRIAALKAIEAVRTAINNHPENLPSTLVDGYSVTRLTPSATSDTTAATSPADPSSAFAPPSGFAKSLIKEPKALVQGRLSFAGGNTATIVHPDIAAPEIAQAIYDKKLKAAKNVIES